MSQQNIHSSLKHLPIWGIKKTFKYLTNIKTGRKLLKSYTCILSIWTGVIFGIVFPFYIWKKMDKVVGESFHVDPGWVLTTLIVLGCISTFSNVFYLAVKCIYYSHNYLKYGNIHTTYRPIKQSDIDRIAKSEVLLNSKVTMKLTVDQIKNIHYEIVNLLKNKKEKEKTNIKLAFEKFMNGDVVGAMLMSPLISYKIAQLQEDTANADIITEKFTNLSMVTEKIENPSETAIPSRLKRIRNRAQTQIDEIEDILELLEDLDLMSINEDTKSSIELEDLNTP